MRPAAPLAPPNGSATAPVQTPLPPSKVPQPLPPREAENVPAPIPSPPSNAPLVPGPVFSNPLPIPVYPEFPEGLDEPPPSARRIQPAGLVALFLAAAALLCASTSALCFLVVPLAILGLLGGLIGVLLARTNGGARLAFASAAAVVACLVLGTALFAPGLLGPTYFASRQKHEEDLTTIRAVPLPGRPPEGELPGPDWVDASRFALQQGRLRVQVATVTVGPLLAPESTKKKANPEEFLVIRLRANRVEAGHEFAIDQARWPGHRGERPRPTLTDNTGKVYRERNVLTDPESVGKSTLFPVAVVDETFAFEAPPPGVEQWRLEVPAALWQGNGTFRFTIPATLATRSAAGPARGGRPGG
jgi:hypothetical protein